MSDVAPAADAAALMPRSPRLTPEKAGQPCRIGAVQSRRFREGRGPGGKLTTGGPGRAICAALAQAA